MRHLLFPTTAQADAFIQDLQSQGLVQPELGSTNINRRTATDTTTTGTSVTGTGAASAYDDGTLGGGTPEDAGAGAVKGTGVGLVAGAVAGTIATVATGGLAAVPVILGMAALGSGVGAGVGAVGGAAGVDETYDGGTYDGRVTDEQYDRLSGGVDSGGRAIAVEDSVPQDAVEAAAARHGGSFV